MTETDDINLRFDKSVDWVEGQIRPMAQAGFLSNREPHFVITQDELLVCAELDFWFLGNDVFPSPLSERQAERLWSMCEQRRGAFDLARRVSASYIHHGWQLPEGLRVFSVLYLGGQIDEPAKTRADKSFFRKFVLYNYSYWSAKLFDLKVTRGDETLNHLSGCDAVQMALERCGVHVSFRTLKDICKGTHQTERDLRRWTEEVYAPRQCEFWDRNQLLAKELGWNSLDFPVMQKRKT